jgi:hypothetical protein
MESGGKGNKGRMPETVSPSPGNVGRPRSPTPTLRYDDAAASGKTYEPTRKGPQMMKASDSPFEPEVLRHLVGKADPAKTQVFLEESAVSFPMTDERGQRGKAIGYFLQYRGPKGSALITPGGEVVTEPRQHMMKNMAPGMKREPGEFPVYSIPKDQLTQPAWKFSSFLPWK